MSWTLMTKRRKMKIEGLRNREKGIRKISSKGKTVKKKNLRDQAKWKWIWLRFRYKRSQEHYGYERLCWGNETWSKTEIMS